jgi:hypothetical protein
VSETYDKRRRSDLDLFVLALIESGVSTPYGLRKSAARKLESILIFGKPDEPFSLPPLGLWYRRLRTASAKALINGDSSAALAMAKALPRSLSGKQPPTRSRTKP